MFAAIIFHSSSSNRSVVVGLFFCELFQIERLYALFFQIHARIHAKPATFTCDACGIVFTRKTPFRKHMKLKHSTAKEFVKPGKLAPPTFRSL